MPPRAKKPAAGLKVENVPIDSLLPHPDNPRRGNVDLIAESLEANDQYRPIVVQASTRHVLAGNHTMLAAQKLGWDKIQAVLLDVDDEKARRILLADNRTGDVGGYDDEALAGLLQSLPDLAGTGYAPADLDDLLADLAHQRPAAGGGNENPNDWQPPGTVVSTSIVFDDAAQQQRWNRFVKWLRDNYDGETVAARLDAYLEQHVDLSA